MRFILGLFALLFIRPIYLLKGLWSVLNFAYDPRGKNDPRNRALDDQLIGYEFRFRLVNQCPLDINSLFGFQAREKCPRTKTRFSVFRAHESMRPRTKTRFSVLRS